MKKLTIIIIVLLLAIGAVGSASRIIPTIYNRQAEFKARDVDFRGVGITESSATLKSKVLIPWSKDGLGGADKYLGTVAQSISESGGAVEPDAVMISSEGIIAIGDRGSTRMFNADGSFAGLREGRPVGFLQNGMLVTSGGVSSLNVYDNIGNIVWQKNVFEDAELQVKKDSSFSIIGAGGSFSVLPSGEIYFVYWVDSGQLLKSESPEHPGVYEEKWEILQKDQGTLVYSSSGELLKHIPGPIPENLPVSPNQTIFGSAIQLENGFAHREFTLNRGEFTLQRTLYLPSPAIYAVGADGSFLCYDRLTGVNENQVKFVVYKENAANAISFLVPEGHWFVSATPENAFYTAKLLENGLLISNWRWPVP